MAPSALKCVVFACPNICLVHAATSVVGLCPVSEAFPLQQYQGVVLFVRFSGHWVQCQPGDTLIPSKTNCILGYIRRRKDSKFRGYYP